MSKLALYDVLFSYKDIHKVVLDLGESLNDDQLHWKPEGYSTSIGFHLWHLARESDFLRAAIIEHFPRLRPEFGEFEQIWARDRLAEKWGFPVELRSTVGTGLSDQAAAALPIPPRESLMDYLCRSYRAIEEFVEELDERYPTYEGLDQEMLETLENVRLNLLVFLAHDCRHLGMMECLKGLQTGFGSATEQRN